MEIEKNLIISAPREQVWALLLNPQVMGAAVPGMQSVEALSSTEYVAVMHQKIAFINARFRLRTRIIEQRAYEYLLVEGTGEDSSVASSLKQRSEIFLRTTPEGRTELRIKVHVDLLGRLGAFGLSVMKTKADRIWEEFGANLAARFENPAPVSAACTAKPEAQASAPPSEDAVPATSASQAPPLPPAPDALSKLSARAQAPGGKGWWGRIFSSAQQTGTAPDTIYVELRRGDTVVSVQWPGARSEQCAAWLHHCLEASP